MSPPNLAHPPPPWLVPMSVSVAAQRTVGVEIGVIVSLSEGECLTLARALMSALSELRRRREEEAR